MEKIKQTIKIDRYVLERNDLSDFENDFLEDILGKTEEEMKVYFNLNNTGLRDFSNFLKVEEKHFENVKEIEKVMKEKGYNFYTVVSFYRENGYDGVYNRTGDDSLTVKCNNWVNFGKDGFLFVVMTKKQEDIDYFVKNLQTYINEGYSAIEVYDNKDEDYIDAYYNLPETPYSKYQEWKEKCIKEYGFKEEDFEKV